jgi:hypothetical protein
VGVGQELVVISAENKGAEKALRGCTMQADWLKARSLAAFNRAPPRLALNLGACGIDNPVLHSGFAIERTRGYIQRCFVHPLSRRIPPFPQTTFMYL